MRLSAWCGIWLWVIACLMPATADPRTALTQRQTDILRMVGQTDGYLNRDLHKEFWSGFGDKAKSDTDRMRLAIDLHYLPFVNTDFQRELWNSAYLSLGKRDMLATPDYSAAKNRLLKFTEVAAFDAPPFVAAVRRADDIIKAAASGQPYVSPQGSTVIDKAFIESALSGLEASKSRLTRLLTPDYPDLPSEWKYPEGHFRIFWPDPLVESRVAIPDGGFGDEAVVYANRYDKDVYVSVQFLALGHAERDPERALLYAELIARQMGFEGAKARVSDWEDRASALVDGKATIEGAESELSLRFTLAPNHEGAWVFVCLAQARPGFAAALRDNLDHAVRPE